MNHQKHIPQWSTYPRSIHGVRKIGALDTSPSAIEPPPQWLNLYPPCQPAKSVLQ